MYNWQGIYEQLKLAAEAFLEGEDGLQIDMQKKSIKLSKILDWYGIDFGKTKEEVSFWNNGLEHVFCYKLWKYVIN